MRGLTQAQLAERVGVTAPAVATWERTDPPAGIRTGNFAALCSALELTEAEFYGPIPWKSGASED